MELKERISKYLNEEGIVKRTERDVTRYVLEKSGECGLNILNQIFEYNMNGSVDEKRFYNLTCQDIGELSYYDLLKSRMREMIEWYFEKVSLGILEGERILDVGCGNGLESCFLGEITRTGEVVGIDINEKMIERARKRAKKRGLSNVRIDCIDRDDWDYNKEKFDRAISVNSLVTPGECYGPDSDLLYGLVINDRVERIMKSLKTRGKSHIFLSVFEEYEDMELLRLRYCIQKSGAKIIDDEIKKPGDTELIQIYVAGEKR